MASTTGIELGPDSCVLAGVRTAQSGADTSRYVWSSRPGGRRTMCSRGNASRRSQIRRSYRKPRGSSPGPAGGCDDRRRHPRGDAPACRCRLPHRPRRDPPQALAILASTRVKSADQNSGVVWLALNMHGAAIAIVRGAELVFGRTFQWAYNPFVLETKAQLLQRYSLIAHLAPEVRRGIAACGPRTASRSTQR